jgi:hypothetical protein
MHQPMHPRAITKDRIFVILVQLAVINYLYPHRHSKVSNSIKSLSSFDTEVNHEESREEIEV